MKRVARAIPFAVAGFMLTPFVLWAGFWFSGVKGVKSGFDGPEAVVLLLSSLPLAGLFWIRNLREMGDDIASPSRLRLARLLTAALPAAIALIGLVGLFWMASLHRPAASIVLVGLAVGAVAFLGWRAASPAGEQASGRAVRGEGWSAAQILLFLFNVAMTLGLLAIVWTPAVLFYAVLALVPIVFGAILILANQGEAS
ncbi:MAG: hypothetical protein RML45_08600 [Acetobacteraceae bacterium]|nr:hypothetical protein [Acetobacteraceae bacterium]